MQTTLSIDDDVLAEAEAMATRHRRSIGEVISSLARQGLNTRGLCETRNGAPMLPLRVDAAPVTPELAAPLQSPVLAQRMRTGFMAGQISVPEDFDQMGQADVEQLFGTST